MNYPSVNHFLGRGHVLALFIGSMCIGSMLVPAAISAQPKPILRINTTIQGAQVDPAVATQSTGEKFFVWEDGARRFEADGTPRDILDFDHGVGVRPDVAMNDQGDVVVVGEVNAEIQARLYTFDDTVPPSGLIGVSVPMSGEEQRAPRVAMDATGSFVAAYYSELSNSTEFAVFVRRFDPDGIPLGAVQQVNSPNQDTASSPHVAMRPDGTLAVSWSDGSGFFPGGELSAMLRVYSSDGSPLTDPILLSPEISIGHGLTFTPNGDLIVMFETLDGILSAIYDINGQLVSGPNFLVESIPGNRPLNVGVAAFDSGEFHIVWDLGNGMADTFGLLLEADGSTQGEPFLVHLDTTGLQRDVDIAAVGNEAIIVFEDCDEDSAGISAACFLPDGCVDVFIDGFESGDTTAWSGSLP